jgi:prephenate dehydratase
VTRVAYLGPPGTFTEEALLTQPDLADADRVPARPVPDVIALVEQGDADVAIVPIENSIEGTVSLTADVLAFETDLLIQREVDLPISLTLSVQRGTKLRDVTTVLSIPIAAAQCRGWLAAKLKGVPVEPAASTAEAAQSVSRSKRTGLAAICTAHAADRYGLVPLARDIEDHPENQTRFVLLGEGIPAPTGHDKTTIVCFQRQDRPGSLLAILQEFAARAINLTKLESRPTKRSLGDYCFLIDFEGHIADELVADALRTLAAKQAQVKFLGSYPVAGQEDVHAKRRAATKAWRDAGAWLDDLRAQVRPS